MLKVVMRSLFLIFTFLNLFSVQVLAGKCAVVCEYNQEVKRVSQNSSGPMKANHECCHGKSNNKKNEAKDSPYQCMGDLCLHKTSNLKSHEYTGQVNNTLKNIVFVATPLFYLPLLVGEVPFTLSTSHQKYNGAQYLKFKVGLRLHILKDQFLI